MKTGKLTNQFNKNDVAEISALTEKTTPIDADPFLLEDSATSYSKKKTLWSSIKSNLLTYFYSYFSKSDGSVNPTNLLSNGDFENWSAGTSVAPDGWTATYGTHAQEGTTKKLGAYSYKITRDASTDTYARQSFTASRGIAYWTGRKVTFGCWVYATVANRASIVLYDNSAGVLASSYHTGNSTWQFLTVTATITGGTAAYAYFLVSNGATSAYFDGAICVEGESAFAFSDKPAIDPGIAVGGTGSAGAGKQYVVIRIGGINYKVLHDGTI